MVFHHFGMARVAMACLLAGAFFFYAFRAAGVVMSVPLMGGISDNATRGRLFAVSNSSFFVANAVTIVALTGIMNLTDSVWMLFAIVIFGACCGITASGFLRRIDETDDEILYDLGENGAILYSEMESQECFLGVIE